MPVKFEEFYSPFFRQSPIIVSSAERTIPNSAIHNRSLHTRHSHRSLSYYSEYQNQKQEHDDNRRLRRKNHLRKNITATKISMESSSLKERGDTFTEIVAALWQRLDLLNSPLGYMIIAATFMLVALLAVIYAILTVALNRRRQRARNKYDEVQLVVVDNSTEFNEFGHPRRYRQLNPHNQIQHTGSTARYIRAPAQISGYDSRSQTPKNSFNSLQRHYVDQHGDGQMSESEMERLYRSISPFRRYPLGAAPTITPSITSEESSTMRRVGGGNGDRGRRIRERLRRPPLEAPPPPPPPRIPPPPIPPHCK